METTTSKEMKKTKQSTKKSKTNVDSEAINELSTKVDNFMNEVEVLAESSTKSEKKSKKNDSKETSTNENNTVTLTNTEVEAEVEVDTEGHDENESNIDEEVDDTTSLIKLADSMQAKLNYLKSEITSMSKEIKDIKKYALKVQKSSKAGKKKKSKTEPKKMKSGIFKNYAIDSPELAAFLSINVGEESCRVNVLKEISKYVKTNNLQIQGKAQRFVIPKDTNDPLHKLFPDIEDMAYTEIMGSIKKFFPVTEAKKTQSETAVPLTA